MLWLKRYMKDNDDNDLPEKNRLQPDAHQRRAGRGKKTTKNEHK